MESPASIYLHFLSLKAIISLGRFSPVSSPCPNLPPCPSPQENTKPEFSKARLCFDPQHISDMLVKSAPFLVTLSCLGVSYFSNFPKPSPLPEPQEYTRPSVDRAKVNVDPQDTFLMMIDGISNLTLVGGLSTEVALGSFKDLRSIFSSFSDFIPRRPSLKTPQQNTIPFPHLLPIN